MAQEVQNGGAGNGVSKAVSFLAAKPLLIVEAPKASDAVQFYKAAFGAEEVNRAVHPKRKAEQDLPLILMAELKLGSSSILVSDSDDSSASVKSLGSGMTFCLETEDVEPAVAKAVEAGAVSEGDIAEGVCGGGRVGKVVDPYGFVWLISSPPAKKCDVVEA